MTNIHNDKILILDFGSQYTQLIARRIREIGIYSEILPYDVECFCDFIFEVDSQSIIQGWQYEGNDCVSNQP